MLPSVAIHYTAALPPVGGAGEVFGLQVAVADWLRGYLRYGRAEFFSFLIGSGDEEREVTQLAAQAGVDPARLKKLDRRFPETNLSSVDLVFRAEPDTRHLLWQRQVAGDFAFCGLAHAISGVEAGEVLQAYCLSPSRDSDAIICPSRAVQSAIRAFWDHYADYLRAQFGATYHCPVQLPVIPLGVDVGAFARRVTPDKRVAQRQALGIDAGDQIVLWVGRLSAAIKAHPLAMFQAVERAAALTGARVHLVMVGYFVPQEAAGQFAALAADICAKATVHFIAADDPRFPDGLWAAGDMFLSLVDNMQESFGLTPIEAMAAGLPRVLSDWDGYRDSVNDGEDGFLIRTTQPPAGNGLELVAQVLSGREIYGGFLAKTALTVAVDAQQAGDRLAQLITDKNLCAAMADKARQRARAVYDWRHIIPAYEDVWGDLSARRKAAREGGKERTVILPQLPDPYTMYAAYPSRVLAGQDRISLQASAAQIDIIFRHKLNTYAQDCLLGASDLAALLTRLAEGAVTIQGLAEAFSALDQARLWRTLAWLQKMGIVGNSACQDKGGGYT